MIYLQMFWTFFQIGLFTIGGGYAMIPMIQQNILGHGWLTETQLIDFIAISESTPGPFAVNIATFVGMEEAGLLGAVCTTLGVILPSFLIILFIARWFADFQNNTFVKSALYGLRPAVVGLIGSAALSILLTNILGVDLQSLFAAAHLPAVSWRAVLIAVIIFVISRIKKKWHPIWLILCAGALGFLFHALLPMIP